MLSANREAAVSSYVNAATMQGGGGGGLIAAEPMLLLILKHQGNAHFSFVQSDILELCSRSSAVVKSVTPFVYPAQPGPSTHLSIALALVVFVDPMKAVPVIQSQLDELVVPGLGTLVAREVREDTLMPIIRQIYESMLTDRPSEQPLITDPNSGMMYRSNWAAPVAAAPPTGILNAQPAAEPAVAMQQTATGSLWVAKLELISLFGAGEGFDVSQAIMGADDRNIHYIINQTGNRVSVSLKGIPENEAPVQERLHLALQSTSKAHFDAAVDMAEDMLQAVCKQYVNYCLVHRLPVPSNTGFVRHLYNGPAGAPPGGGFALRYLGQRERPRIWLQDVPPELLVHCAPPAAAQHQSYRPNRNNNVDHNSNNNNRPNRNRNPRR